MAKISLHCHVPLLLNVTLFLSLVSANCFFPNGTDRNGPNGDRGFKPCNPHSGNSMCCLSIDHCRTDGLCTDTAGNYLWRESCTDRTWKSPSCIKLCVNGIAVGQPKFGQWNDQMVDNDVTITQCSDGSYCCGTKADGCCSSNKGVWLANGTTTNVNPYPTSSTTAPISALSPIFTPSFSTTTGGSSPSSGPSFATTSSPITTSSPTTTSNPTTTSSPTASSSISPNPVDSSSTITTPVTTSSSPTHTSAIVGGTIGGIAVLALIVAATWFLARRRAPRNRNTNTFYAELEEKPHTGLEQKPIDRKKMPTFMPLGELPAGRTSQYVRELE